MSAITEAIEDGRLQGRFQRAVQAHESRQLIDIVGKLIERVENLERLIHPDKNNAAKSVKPAQIILRIVCNHFHLTPDRLLSETRASHIAWPRQIFMYLMREHTTWSLPQIGEFIIRDHGTILHGWRRVKNAIEVEPETKVLITELSNEIASILKPKPATKGA